MAEEELSWAAVLAWRVAQQGLQRRTDAADWPQVVSRICGLHAQVQSSAELTLWARVDDLDPAAVSRALWSDRTLVRTWAMRGTLLHLLPAAELATWVGAQGALRPRYETAPWRKAFGMSSEEAVAVLDAIRAARPRGARQLRDDAEARGVPRRRLLRAAGRPEGALHATRPLARRRLGARAGPRGDGRRRAPPPRGRRAREPRGVRALVRHELGGAGGRLIA
jgi:hypothetical protein